MKLCSRPTLHTRRTPTRLAFADHMGDREKPGAERAPKLILVYYVPPQTLSSWHPSLDTEAEAIQLEPKRTLSANCPKEFFRCLRNAKRAEFPAQDRI